MVTNTIVAMMDIYYKQQCKLLSITNGINAINNNHGQ